MNKRFFVPFTLIAMLLLAACTPVFFTTANSSSSAETSQPAVTATVNIPVTGQLQTPTATEIPTQTPTQTQTPTLVPTQAPTLLPTQTPVVAPCNQAGFVGDVTYPDGSVIDPGSTFTKIWRLRNDGACSWTTGYAFIYNSGNLMSGPTVVSLPTNVNPGNTIDLSVTLVAPLTSGTYQGNWMLRDSSGNLFGLGTNAAQPFWVNIVVDSSTSFAVTEVSTSLNPTSYSGICPATFTFDANIWTNDAGTVTYYWRRSDGSNSPEITLTYTGAGYQTVSDIWTFGTAGSSIDGWDQVYIDQPNHQAFHTINFTAACNSPTQTQAPLPTNTPAPTAVPPTLTPTPTQTPLPTNTPAPTAVPPTLTPTPTQTPLPTNTPTPTEVPPTLTTTPTQTPLPTNTPTPTAVPPTLTPTQPAPTETSTPS